MIKTFALMCAACALAAPFSSSALIAGRTMDGADYEMPAIPSLRDRATTQDRWLKQRLDTLVPAIMRENHVDMWIVAGREYDEDPILKTMLPAAWVSARRRMILIFFDRGPDKGVERLAVARYAVDDLFPSAWDPEKQPDQWKQVATLIRERDPKTIAINVSDTFPLADGLSASQYREMREALGPELSSRIVEREGLGLSWLETRIPGEMATWRVIMRMAHAVVAEGLSEKAIVPGVTTTADVEWWYRERLAALKVDAWCHPSAMVQRADVKSATPGHDAPGAAEIIMPGDLVNVDFCSGYMGLKTDTQQMAYVLRPGETEAPKGLRDGIAAANRLQDALTAEFHTGRSGNEILARARASAIAKGLDPIIYSHPIGYHGHAAGPSIGSWDDQSGPPGAGEYKLRPNTAYSLELSDIAVVPEWGNQKVRFFLEVDGYFDGKSLSYIDGRQTELHLIPRQ
jgi:Xaa-Pro aminopeptidase